MRTMGLEAARILPALVGLALVGLMPAGCDDGGGGSEAVDGAADATPDTAPADAAPDPEPDADVCAPGETRVCDRAIACRGIERCVDGVFGPCEAAPELCNGLDDDCDDETDEGYAGLGDACREGIGACAAEGRVACAEDGQGVACDAAPSDPGEELCNGLDDDCDGMPDEGFDVAAECTVGLGACAVTGLVVCDEDGAAVCGAEAAAPAAEACNDIDDDCDGQVDEALGVGDACVSGLGACAVSGIVACDPDERAACDAVAGAPGDEVCNAIDDDCDGAVDEGFGVGAQCRAGDGVCANTGAVVCAADGGVRCEAQVLEPGEETCNSLDDDCDGAVDEGYRVGRGCAVGLGACVAQGTIVCAAAGDDTTCDAVAGAPAAELCNAVDDDCDGRVDEGLGLGDVCPVGVGGCVAEGRLICADGGGVACEGAPGAPAPEACNAIDDDCDGTVDEGTGAGDVCRVGIGACAVDGQVACGPDGGLVCAGELGVPSDEVCNDIDDDCDGMLDEGFGVGRACLTDALGCLTPGSAACRDGQPACLPVNAASQLGDGRDGELVVAAGEAVVLDRPLYAFTRLVVAAGGRLGVPAFDPASGLGGQVEIRVAGEAIIEPGAVIDLAGSGWPGARENPLVPRGYAGAWGPEGGSTGYHGAGPGGGQGGFSAPQVTVGAGGGGGHGTAGGAGVACGLDQRAFSVWDVNTDQPLPIAAPPANFSMGGPAHAEPGGALSMGSGGGGGGNNYDGGQAGIGGPGGVGGGAIRLSASRLVIGGQILADGRPGGDGIGGNFVGGGGGGAGGAVQLIAGEIAFGGTITASGGAGGEGQHGSVGGGGGDGWIHIAGDAVEGDGDSRPPAQVTPAQCVARATFDYTGDVEIFTVPPGVTALYVEAWGAQGGDSESCDGGEVRQADGGLGGYVAGVVAVQPGDQLTVRVGGQPELVLGGVTPGGYNGGGSAGQYGGAGGGASDVRVGGDGLEHRVIVAGGGGGGNTGCPDHGGGGIGGGLIGGDGGSFQGNPPGLGGSQEAGGAAGLDGLPGAAGVGGGLADYHFSGGGGGYFGGGNGYATGAGGGSSYFGAAALGETEAGAHAGPGRVVIHY